jgi:hypothetical protein
MQNGTYKVEFTTKLGHGTGIVVFRDGQIRGGDSSMLYVGSFTKKDKELVAEVKADVHSQVQGMSSVFGTNSVNIVLKGKMSNVEDSILLDGSAKEAPGVEFKAYLKKLCD